MEELAVKAAASMQQDMRTLMVYKDVGSPGMLVNATQLLCLQQPSLTKGMHAATAVKEWPCADFLTGMYTCCSHMLLHNSSYL